MFRKMFVFGALAAGVGLAGCATHDHKVEGAQARSEIPEGIRVGIGSKEVKEGDRVSVLRSECTERSSGRAGGSRTSCRDIKVGEALVLKVLDHDTAIVRPDLGVVMDSKLKVEKL